MNKIHAKDIRFGMRGHDLGSDFDEMIENAKKYNVHTLQFALAKTVNEVDFDSVGYDKALSDKISAALRENDLSVAVLGCYINPVDRSETELEKSLRRFTQAISMPVLSAPSPDFMKASKKHIPRKIIRSL